jgi:hypothetical protein
MRRQGPQASALHILRGLGSAATRNLNVAADHKGRPFRSSKGWPFFDFIDYRSGSDALLQFAELAIGFNFGAGPQLPKLPRRVW